MFGYRHFIVINKDSITLAIASECAAKQDAFWRFHDAYYESLDSLDPIFGPDPAEKALEIIQDIDINANKYKGCMVASTQRGSPIYERVKASHQDALANGVDATPTLAINGRLTQGSPEEFMQAIQAALKAARSLPELPSGGE